jgi:A/G-specific adenine glycosylase
MLQQTQVARVVERYRAFMRRFPTVRRLASAGAQEVLAAWQGLGYYRRAASLHAAAKVIADDFGGRVPESAAELEKLPGVGRYTAASIASIVHGERVPLVDANVLRVLARIEARPGRARDAALGRWAWRRAGALVAAAPDAGAFNEGMMELGAVVCTPRAPRCADCPLASCCRAAALGRQDRIPAPARPANRRREHHHAVVVRRGSSVLLEQRPVRGMWSGMWQVPTVEAARAIGPAGIEKAIATPLRGLRKRGTFTHGTTHREITFHVYTATTAARRGTWRRPDRLDDLPMSNAQRKVLAVAIDGD